MTSASHPGINFPAPHYWAATRRIIRPPFTSFLLSYAAGGGSSYTLSAGIGSSDDFSTQEVRVVFAFFLGSFYGDWNNESNFLRASLGSGHTLAAAYAGFPHWFLQPMAMGETIGSALRLTQNNRPGGELPPYNQGAGEVHISLLGDPTLRLHPVLPPSNLSAQSGNGVRLTWGPSPDSNLRGYHLYRSVAGQRNFQRLNADPITGTEFFDPAPDGEYAYMLRALKLDQSPSGSYFNLSQGIFASAQSSGSTAQPLVLRLDASGSNLSLHVSGQAGSTFEIESSPDLRNWTPSGRHELITSELTVPLPMQDGTQYFRAKLIP